MTLREYLDNMYEEKAFRSRIYIGSQIKNAKKVDGYPSIYDVLNSDDENEYLFVFGTADKWADASVCDPGCNSPFIDGEWGWYYPDNNDTFYPFSDYGKTWIALNTKEATAEEGWPKVDEARKILADK